MNAIAVTLAILAGAIVGTILAGKVGGGSGIAKTIYRSWRRASTLDATDSLPPENTRRNSKLVVKG